MFQFLKKNVHKILAPYIVAGVAYLVALGIELPAEFALVLADLTATFLAASLVALAGIVQRLIAARTNPENTAK